MDKKTFMDMARDHKVRNEGVKIPLDADQRRFCREFFTAEACVEDVIASIISRLTDKRARERAEFWKQIYEIAGVDPDTHNVKICNVSNVLLVTPYESEAE